MMRSVRHIRRVLGLGLCAGLCAGLVSEAARAVDARSSATYDILIRNGTVFDGTGAPGRHADVAIKGDRIVRVGRLRRAHAPMEIDASGLYVTPGFISLHDHTTTDSYARPESLLTQGVTTAIANPDGRGPLDIAEQLDSPAGLGLNFGAYIGFNSVWQEVVGLADHRAGPADMARMRDLVRAAMERGAFGLSAGLDYKPGYWANTSEVIEVAKAAAPWRTDFPNHERLDPANGFSSMAGMAETLEIGAHTGLAPVITHMKLQGRDRGKADAAFAMVHDAIRRGVHVGIDAYAYTYGITNLEQLLIPAWAQAGGREPMLARFADAMQRPRIVAETEEQMRVRWGGAANVFLPSLHKELTQVMQEMGGISGGEAVVRLLEQGVRRVILRYGTDADLTRILEDPLTAISCDCGSGTDTAGHPRQWGAFPRFLGRFVREKKLVSWGEAVRKMTALPAAMIGLAERGYLVPGMIADVTIFDPDAIEDRATIDAPAVPSVGVREVIVNGRLAVHAGELTGVMAGAHLRRSKHEPTRSMSVDIDRSVRVAATLIGTTTHIRMRVSQSAHALRPIGAIRVSGVGRRGFTVMNPSIVQADDAWASVTGIARWDDGREDAVTVLVERADPSAGNMPTVTVLADGVEIAAGALPRDSAMASPIRIGYSYPK